jgi:hypothetical protein
MLYQVGECEEQLCIGDQPLPCCPPLCLLPAPPRLLQSRARLVGVPPEGKERLGPVESGMELEDG